MRLPIRLFFKNRRFKIRNLLIISISFLLITITISVSAVNFIGIKKMLGNNMYVYIDEMTRKTVDGIDSFLNDIDTMALYILQDNEIAHELKIINEQGIINYNSKLVIENRLNDYKMPFLNRYKSIWIAASKQIGRIGVVETQNSFSPDEDMQLLDEFLKKSSKFVSGETLWTGIYEFNRSMEPDGRKYASGDLVTNKSFFAVKNMKSLEDFRSQGVLIIEVEGSQLKNVFNTLSVKNEGIILLDTKGRMILSNKPELTDKSLVGEIGENNFGNVLSNTSGHFIMNSKYYSYSTSRYSGWKMVGIFPFSEINNDIFEIQQIIILVSVIGIIIGVFVATFISLRIERPIKKLVRKMDDLKADNLNIKINTDSNISEIYFLNNEVMNLFTRIRDLIHDVILEQKKEKELELKVLQLQINPHFLYNTLDTLHWQLILNEQHDTANAVIALSNLLRYSISKGDGISVIEEELKQLENYITIQKLRFGNRFDVIIDFEDSILKYSIPKLTLQPIVENAINHGLRGKNNYGTVKIKGILQKDIVLITVEDNGIGIQEEDLLKIQGNKFEPKSTGLGIKNVNDRIALQLGIKNSVTIESEYRKGTTVYIRLPLEEREF